MKCEEIIQYEPEGPISKEEEKELYEKKLKAVKQFSSKIKIQNNKIIFLNFSGNFDCNVKAIALKILEKKNKYELVWAVFKHTNVWDFDNFPAKIKIVVYGTLDFYKELASSKYIFDNSINMISYAYRKKRGQILFETWHGSLGIKMFGRQANNDYEWHNKADVESLDTNYIISNSLLEDDIYRKTFWQKTNILRFGHARNDVLFLNEDNLAIKEIKDKIRFRYKISPNAKWCLYAPTFRDEKNLSVYKMDFISLKEALSERFGGEWVILFRYHDGTKRQFWDEIENPENVVNVSDYPDITDFLACIDAGITDYSSWICEYLLRRKPGFIYAQDYEAYSSKERPLIIDLKDLPFPYSTSESSLFETIKNFNNDDYIEKCDAFINKCGSIDDGKASERIYQFLEGLGKEK